MLPNKSAKMPVKVQGGSNSDPDPHFLARILLSIDKILKKNDIIYVSNVSIIIYHIYVSNVMPIIDDQLLI